MVPEIAPLSIGVLVIPMKFKSSTFKFFSATSLYQLNTEEDTVSLNEFPKLFRAISNDNT